MSAASPATKAPKEPNALPSVPMSTGTASRIQAEVLEHAAPARAHHAEAVRIVDHQPGLRGPRGRAPAPAAAPGRRPC